MSPIIFFAVFIATCVIDGLYALYTLRVTQKKALQSALFGVMIHLLTAFTVISYTKNYLYIIALAFGSFIGTYIIVKHCK